MTRAGIGTRYTRRAKIFAITKGFYGKRKNCWTIAIRAAERAMQASYIGRKLKKRDMRSLWIQRINYGAKEHNINYSQFVNGLAKADVQLNRKVLSEMAMHEPRSFQALAELAKAEQKQAATGLKQLLS